MDYKKALDYSENRSGGTEKDLPLLKQVFSSLSIEKLPKMIRLIGTNGKGTTGSMISSLMTAAGVNHVHLTSPHIVDYRERIYENGEFISKKDFISIVERLEKIEKDLPKKISYFSFAILIGLIHAVEKKVDYIILESGIGGKRDITNSLETIIGTIFTKISLDHEEILGETIAEIAQEKGEGLKGFGLLLAQEKEVEEIILEIAKEKNLPLEIVDPKKLKVSRKNGELEISKNGRIYTTSLLGDFQVENASLAIETIERLGISLPEKLSLGFGLPGRMEEVSKKPRILLDGGHNQEALDYLMSLDQEEGDLYILFGQMSDKDLDLTKMKEKAKKIYYTKAQDERAKDFLDEENFYESSSKAFETIRRELKEEDTLIILGSFYLIGEILEFLGEENGK